MTSPENQETARAIALRRLLIETAANTTSRPTSRTIYRRAPLIVVGALIAGLAVIPLTPLRTATDIAVTPVTAHTTEAPFPGPSGGMTADAYFFSSPTEMADSFPLVFRGVVQSVTLGSEQTGIPESPQFGETPLLVLTDLTVSKGDVDLRDDGTILFALPGYHVGSDWSSLSDVAEQFPRGTEIIAYANHGWLMDNSWGVSNGPLSDPPRPINTPEHLYAAFHPQALIVQRPDSTYLHWPYLGTAQEANLTDTLPDGNLVGADG